MRSAPQSFACPTLTKSCCSERIGRSPSRRSWGGSPRTCQSTPAPTLEVQTEPSTGGMWPAGPVKNDVQLVGLRSGLSRGWAALELTPVCFLSHPFLRALPVAEAWPLSPLFRLRSVCGHKHTESKHNTECLYLAQQANIYSLCYRCVLKMDHHCPW